MTREQVGIFILVGYFAYMFWMARRIEKQKQKGNGRGSTW